MPDSDSSPYTTASRLSGTPKREFYRKVADAHPDIKLRYLNALWLRFGVELSEFYV